MIKLSSTFHVQLFCIPKKLHYNIISLNKIYWMWGRFFCLTFTHETSWYIVHQNNAPFYATFYSVTLHVIEKRGNITVKRHWPKEQKWTVTPLSDSSTYLKRSQYLDWQSVFEKYLAFFNIHLKIWWQIIGILI